MIGVLKGYDVVITVHDRTSAENFSTLYAYVAKVYVCPDTDALDDPEGYHVKVDELCHKILDAFMPINITMLQIARRIILQQVPRYGIRRKED